jgi:hypothetical protein
MNKIMKHLTCSCPNPKTINGGTYPEFDKIVRDELKNLVTADQIVNNSGFCTNVPLGYLQNDFEDTVTIDDLFHRLKGRQGLYQLWVLENYYCDIHKVVSMRCLYVGKGKVLKRAKKHIEEKWPEEGQFYISFYECENRISKYLEQLFLDIYKCDMNKHENPGVAELFGYWSLSRYGHGSETAAVADRFSLQFLAANGK